MRKAMAASGIVIALCGCSHDTMIYPTLDEREQGKLISAGAAHARVPATVDDARNLVIGWTIKLDTASQHRDYAKIVAQELLFYGSLLAIGGIAAGSAALRNIGAGIAGGSIALDHHYQLADQENAFRRAAVRMRCARDLLDPIDPAVLDALPETARTTTLSSSAMADYYVIPRTVSRYVDRVGQDLRVSLSAIALAPPSQQDILNTLTAFRTANNPPQHELPSPSSLVTSIRQARQIATPARGQKQEQEKPASAPEPSACAVADQSDDAEANSRACRAYRLSQESPTILADRTRALAQAVNSLSTGLEVCLKTNPQ
ncbi:hypothetical protein [Burkholderia territorii]|uniref:hypothetical protein n=1 Tax=Burkholderia territorii TaxID=1503055 RepID=UPI0012DAD917|nr:hypothetical protein [Burkholderia territorii]